ncbi:MAG TPA: TM2 domain-containing protein [Haloplasmataceae bacterium]
MIGKSKIIAILLALFLGRYGIHKFYLGKPALGLLYLIFSRFQIVFFLSICDAFIYLFMDQDTWLKEYGYKKRKYKKENEK